MRSFLLVLALSLGSCAGADLDACYLLGYADCEAGLELGPDGAWSSSCSSEYTAGHSDCYDAGDYGVCG